jgi:hypothetical protein
MPGSDAQCSRCGREFDRKEQVACISGRIMGDEYTDCFYWCGACEVYTIRMCRDAFAGPETAHNSDVISKEAGDRRLKLIQSCPAPYDGRCRCASHREYFGDCLD